MSDYYKGKRTRNLYDPSSSQPFRLSRSRIELFLSCACCFYIDRRLGVDRPPGYPFNLNSAVDNLLKAEFDSYRKQGDQHPLLAQFEVAAKPAQHKMLDEWRQNFKGVQYLHEPTNLLITGAIDDLWQLPSGEYVVVDYKATAKNEPVTELGDASHHDSYRRQMEVYQWLLRKNGLPVSDTSYFVYCTGRPEAGIFDAKLEFDIHLIAYKGSDEWVEETLGAIHKTLQSDTIPGPDPDCDFCLYWAERAKLVAGG